ncbi:hypothetical protein FOTG_18279 [Fusarium oxysporum f. sp. vasinfectum 25433]|uniref:Uncharacterized protein n=1 Tax=Fusarium oxysporum f. sp. vasinfectum 25433 TaxID=1089449 RepID=X0KX49_FUSOX|nr:hypothetical protein FOTG_18279 [Fusarium oxysporum f. sp. vasinfectum 25433]
MKEDIDEATSLHEEALRKLPIEHFNRVGCLKGLGVWMESEMTTATPSVRVELAQKAASIHAKREEWKEASDLLETAIELLPLLSLRPLKETDKEEELTELSGLVSDAAAISLNVYNKPYDALQLMERGRGVIVDPITGKEKHLDDLEKKHPDLANRFRTLRGQLAIPADLWNSSSTSLIPHEIPARHRQMAYDDLIDLVAKIRSETEFDDFLLVQLGEEVMGFGKYGPFVLINTSRYRCDAFLI